MTHFPSAESLHFELCKTAGDGLFKLLVVVGTETWEHRARPCLSSQGWTFGVPLWTE